MVTLYFWPRLTLCPFRCPSTFNGRVAKHGVGSIPIILSVWGSCEPLSSYMRPVFISGAARWSINAVFSLHNGSIETIGLNMTHVSHTTYHESLCIYDSPWLITSGAARWFISVICFFLCNYLMVPWNMLALKLMNLTLMSHMTHMTYMTH